MSDETQSVGAQGDKPFWLRSEFWLYSVFGGFLASIFFWLISTIGPKAVNWIVHGTSALVSKVSQSTVDSAYRDSVADPVLADITLLTILVIVYFAARMMEFFLDKYWNFFKQFYPHAQKWRVDYFKRLTTNINNYTARAFLVVFGILLVFEISLTYQVVETENRRLLVLTPYITDQERKELIGEWGGITGKADFDKMMRHMETLASTHKVNLPKRYDE